MKFFKDELKKIRAFVFDVDGVLSHQSQNLTPDGELIRTSCTKDGYAIMYAIRKGYIIAVISGGGAPGVRERLEKLGVRPEDIYLKVANKTEALAEIEQRYSMDPKYFDYDIEAFVNADYGTHFAEAISDITGGDGCVRDVISQVLKAKGDWMDTNCYVKSM